MKYLGVTLTKQLKDLYDQYFKILKKETGKDIKDLLYLWIGKINIVKMAILPKAINRFSAIPIQIAIQFFTDLEKQFSNSLSLPSSCTTEQW